MTPRSLKIIGTLFLTFGVFTLMFGILGEDFALMPWPASLIVIGIGVFFLRQGGGVEGWNRGTRNGSGSS